ncbi:endogenous retrovirus group K member 8 Gag polyprotein [Halichoerus grypus]
MGQSNLKTSGFAALIHHFLKEYGAKVTKQCIEKCLETVVEYNPWFPDEGSLDEETWIQMKNNVLKAMRQDETILLDFWPIWALIRVVINTMETGDKLSPAEIAKETTNSLHTYELDDETLEKAKTESKVFAASQSRPLPTAPPLLTEDPTEDDQPPSTDLFPLKRSSLALSPLEKELRRQAANDLCMAFPVDRTQAAGPVYEGLDLNALRELKKACHLYGPTAPYTIEILKAWANSGEWIRHDWHMAAWACLKPQDLLQWKMWLSDASYMKARANWANPAMHHISFEMLTGSGPFSDVQEQLVNTPPAATAQESEIALAAWGKLTPSGEMGQSYIKIVQDPTEAYTDFISLLEMAIDRQVDNKPAKEHLLKQLAFENANEDCQAAIRPHRETGGILDYLRLCRNIGTLTRQARITSLQLMALQKQQDIKCCNCGKVGHVKKKCHKAPQPRANSPSNTAPSLCPHCGKGKHWAKECKSKFDRQGIPLPLRSGNGMRGHPGPRTTMGDSICCLSSSNFLLRT